MKKIAVFISSNGANLTCILDACADRVVDGVVDLVVTCQDDTFELKLADDAGIENIHYDRARYDSVQVFYDDLTTQLEARGIDHILLFEYDFEVPQSFIEKFYLKIMAIHPSLNPAHIHDADAGLLAAKDIKEAQGTEAGTTAYFLHPTDEVEHVIAQEKVAVFQGDNVFAIYQRVRKAQHYMAPRVLSKWISGHYKIAEDGTVVDSLA